MTTTNELPPPTPRFVLNETGMAWDDCFASDNIRECVEQSQFCEQHWQIMDTYDDLYVVSRGPGSKTACDSSGNYITVEPTAFVDACGHPVVCCRLIFDESMGYLASCLPGEQYGFGDRERPSSYGRPCLRWFGGTNLNFSTAEKLMVDLIVGRCLFVAPENGDSAGKVA